MPQGEGYYGSLAPTRQSQRVPGGVFNPNSPSPQRYSQVTSTQQAPATTPVTPPGPTPPPAGQPGIMAGPPPAYWNPSVPGIFQAPGVTPANVAPKGYNWNQSMANTLMGGTL